MLYSLFSLLVLLLFSIIVSDDIILQHLFRSNFTVNKHSPPTHRVLWPMWGDIQKQFTIIVNMLLMNKMIFIFLVKMGKKYHSK